MYYFLTHTINDKLAGLEIAIMKRLKIFKHLNEPAKILVINYNRLLHSNMAKYQLADDDVISLYDYFQGTQTLPAYFEPQNDTDSLVDKYLNTFPANELKVEVHGNQRVLVDTKSNQARITLRCFNHDEQHVAEVSWWDRAGKLVRFDGYDDRGFLSMSSFYGQDGGVATETAFKVDGTPVITSYYHADQNGNIKKTLITLTDDKGGERSFASDQELGAYFYDQIAKDDETPVTFIADRSYVVDGPLFLMQEPVRKYEYWHNAFTIDYTQGGPINDLMLNEFKHFGELSGYLVSTERAANDLQKRVPAEMKVHAIPVALNEENHPWVPLEERTPNKIILVGRVEQQKNIPAALQALKLIKEKFPAIKLHIYGYILEFETNRKVHALVDELGLQDNVVFENYTLTKDKIYQDAQLLIMTSRNEGWGMALNEAMAYGVPMVSFDIDYGPAEVITDGVDGYVVPQNDYEALAERSIELLGDDAKRAEFGKAGQENIQRFNLEPMAERWRALLQQIESED